MTKSEHVLDKNMTFDAAGADWIAFIDQLSYKRSITFHGALHNDTVCLDTAGDVWWMRRVGVSYTFDFNKIDNTHIRQLMKWAVYKFLSNYSIGTVNIFYRKFVLGVREFAQLTLPALVDRLIALASKAEKTFSGKNHSEACQFSIIKRFLGFLIDEGAPNTDIEDHFILEQLPCPKRETWHGYYELEVKLKPLEIQFVHTHYQHDSKHLNRLSYNDLRAFVTLRICYEIGLRPIQLFKLSKLDFQNIDDKYFSLHRPLAKHGRENDNKVGVDKLSISPELGRSIQTLISRQTGTNQQLLQHKNGSSSSTKKYNHYINQTLKRWGAKDIFKTAYDFRHNLAHSMAMAGSSSSDIAYMLGHSSEKTAKHYILACPNIAYIREKALANNATWGAMVALLTGEITIARDWQGETVFGMVGNQLITGIGGCDAKECEFNPILNCYGCNDFYPFVDGNHEYVFKSLQAEVKKVIAISDISNQTAINPAFSQLEGILEQVKSVIGRCKSECQGCQNPS